MFCRACLRILIRRQKSFAYFTGRPANHFQAADLARFVSSVHRSSALRVALFKAGRALHFSGLRLPGTIHFSTCRDFQNALVHEGCSSQGYV
jgi:hypothetical protein